MAEGWIERRTGIRERRVAEPEERLATHATRAAENALLTAGVAAADVDLVLVATTTADEVLPNAAPFTENYRVFVHVVDTDDKLMWTDDHDPPIPSTQWKPGQ